ncbi:P2Y purinoceptor 13 [Xyrauchen texanus]|uniref:P2Y purinoceptor 13 n=1 Tax=Xyrauchen texanus TaxID=154827 RepID=UPI0022425F54|nr:P2Y purinoceptor 13 [Xyrauchen texanus]
MQSQKLFSLRKGPDIMMNASQVNTSVRCERDTSVTSILFPCLYAALFLLALVLNSLGAWIFFQIRSSSTFVVYLKNVVVADLLMTLTLPVKVLTDAGLGSWHLRAFHCRYSAVLFYTTMYISILLLGFISLDRYLKIVHPFGKCALQRVRFGQVLCAVIWVVMLSLALPNVILSNQILQIPTGGRLRCTMMKGKVGLLWHEGFNYFCQVVFWGTLALMVVCYTFISRKVIESYRASRSSSVKASKQTTSKVFVVVAVFFVCFAPFHLARVPYTLSQTRNTLAQCWTKNQLYFAKETTLWLSSANICLDPLIYVFLCRVFRKKLAAMLMQRSVPHGPSLTDTSTRMEMPNITHLNTNMEY